MPITSPLIPGGLIRALAGQAPALQANMPMPPQPRQMIVQNPRSELLARALLEGANAGGNIETPMEGFGRMAQLFAGNRLEDKRLEAEEARKEAEKQQALQTYTTLAESIGADSPYAGLAKALIGSGDPELARQGIDLLIPKARDPQNMMGVSPGETVFDPNTGRPLYTAPPAIDSPEAFTLAPGQTRFGPDGQPLANVPEMSDLLPQDVEEQKIRIAKESRPQTTINVGPTGVDYGDPEAGLAWARNPDGTVKLDERGAPIAVPYQGGSVAREEAAATEKSGTQAEQAATYADVVTQDIDRAIAGIDAAEFPVTGIGSILSAVPGTPAHDVSRLIDTIKANVGFDRLQQMRASSPTGGALGPVSDFENQLLQATIGNLALSQSKPQLLFNLARVKQIYAKIVNEGIKPGDPILNGASAPAPVPSPKPQRAYPNIPSPADAFKAMGGGPAPEGVTQEEWEAMTPEERALWQN